MTRDGASWTRRRIALVLVAAVVVIWLVIKAADDPRQFLVVTVNGTTLAALYFVVASGFTLIFGLMRVVNMAHGSLYLLGGYLALQMQESWFKPESGDSLGLSLSGDTDATYSLMAWIVPLLIATGIIGVIGVIIQQVFLRWNQGQDLRQALITIALSVIFADQMLAAFGGISKDIKTPTDWPGSISVFDVRFGFFRTVVVLGSALLIGLGLWWLIRRTRFGKIVRAGVDDRDMVSALGINVQMIFALAFLLGGYIALEIQTRWFESESSGLGLSLSGATDTEYSVWAWFVPLVLATVIVGVIGVAMQQIFLRWNQGQDLRQALITIALSVILADQMLAYWGGISKDISAPSNWPTSIVLPGDVRFGFFRGVIVLAAALAIGLGLYLIIKRTRFGKIVRAGVDDRDMVSALGINVNRVFIGMFFLGSALAGLGGVLGGTMISLAPGQDTAFLLNSLIVVIIGGMGSLGGAAIGALALGLVDAYADVYLVFGDLDLTNYSIIVTFALLVGVLAVRPLGLYGRPA